MKRLLSYMGKYKKESICAPLFKMFEAILELLVPLVIASMMDVGVKNHDTSYILRMGLLLLFLAAIGLIAAIIAQYFAAKTATMTGTMIRRDLYAHLHTLSWKQIDTLGTSTLITRMTSDINTVQNGVNMFLRLFLRSPFVVFGALIMAFTVDTKTALIFAVAIPILMVIIFVILLTTMPLYKKVQKQLDIIMQSTRENLLGVRVVRAFNRQEDEITFYKEASTDLFRKQLFVGRISALLNPLTYAIINIGIVCILYFGGIRVDAGHLTAGKVIALINYMSQILVELVKFANLVILISRAMASNRRINELFDITNDQPDGNQAYCENADGMTITFNHADFSYDEDADLALHDISFDIPSGSTIGIIGGTGSGKSTLVHLIPRFYDLTSGKITVNGTDVLALKKKELRARVGMVPQKAVLFKGTLRDNMKWGNESATDEEITEALDIAQALPFVEEKGEGLDLRIEQEGRNLSGGQRQRLTIARALVRKPELLILDDSASALDFATDAALRHSIKTRAGKRTVILVSQRVSTIKNADCILVLDDGHLVGIGTHEELLRTNDVYQEICESQLSSDEILSMNRESK